MRAVRPAKGAREGERQARQAKAKEGKEKQGTATATARRFSLRGRCCALHNDDAVPCARAGYDDDDAAATTTTTAATTALLRYSPMSAVFRPAQDGLRFRPRVAVTADSNSDDAGLDSLYSAAFAAVSAALMLLTGGCSYLGLVDAVRV